MKYRDCLAVALVVVCFAASARAATAADWTLSPLPGLYVAGLNCDLSTDDGCVLDKTYWGQNNYDVANPLSFFADWPISSQSGFEVFNPSRCMDMGSLSNATGLTGIVGFSDSDAFFVDGGQVNGSDYWTNFNGTDGEPVAGRVVEIMKLALDLQNTSPCLSVMSQYFAASLNACNGACMSTAVIDALQALSPYVYQSCSSDVESDPTSVVTNFSENFAVVRGYNYGETTFGAEGCAGRYGPGYCPSGPFNTSKYLCPQDLSEVCNQDFSCTGGCTQLRGFWKNRLQALSSASKKRKEKKPGWGALCPATYTTGWEESATCDRDAYASAQPMECRRAFGGPEALTQPEACPSGADLTLADALTVDAPNGQMCVIALRQMVTAENNAACQETAACLPSEVRDTLDVMWGLVNTYCSCLGQSNNPEGLNRDLANAFNLTNATNATLLEVQARKVARADLNRYTEFIRSYNRGVHGPGTCKDLAAGVLAADPVITADNKVAVGWFIWGIIAIVLIALVGLGAVVMFAMGWYGDRKAGGEYHAVETSAQAPSGADAYYQDPTQVLGHASQAVTQRKPFYVGSTN